MVRRSLLLTIAVLLSSAPASAETRTLKERLQGFSVAVHRGNGLRADSNTMAGFESALKAGPNIIETDLRLTHDGVPVVSHDAKLPTPVGAMKRIADMTWAEVQTCRVGGTFPVPSFDQVLAWADGRLVINAEFKVREVIPPAVALVSKYHAHDWIYFQTQSDPRRYQSARAVDPVVALQFKPLDEKGLDWALNLHDDHLVVIELNPSMRRDDVIGRIHAAGKLASENAWHFSLFGERLWNQCDSVYARTIDIAVTDDAKGGVTAAAAWNTGHGSERIQPRQLGEIALVVACPVVLIVLFALRQVARIRKKLRLVAVPLPVPATV